MRKLAGPQLKIKRALLHLSTLQQMEKVFWAENADKIECLEEFDAAYNSRCAKLKLRANVDEEMHVISGELIYQLRSALDQTAIALARATVPTPKLKGIYFPSGKTESDFEDNVSKNLKGVDTHFVDVVRQLKVFPLGNPGLYSVFPMANVDKHNQLLASHPQGRIASAYDVTVSNADVGLVVGGLAPLKEGVVISILGENGHLDAPPLSMGMSGEITLSSADDYDGRPLLPLLEDMIFATRTAVRRLRSALAAV